MLLAVLRFVRGSCLEPMLLAVLRFVRWGLLLSWLTPLSLAWLQPLLLAVLRFFRWDLLLAWLLTWLLAVLRLIRWGLLLCGLPRLGAWQLLLLDVPWSIAFRSSRWPRGTAQGG